MGRLKNSNCMHIDDQKKKKKSEKVKNSENIRIPKLGKFSNYFGKIPKCVGSKNRLVHPELWVCHFGRFLNFASETKFYETSTRFSLPFV